jgi:hypothetical protein
MFQKILNNFDINTDGWFDDTTTIRSTLSRTSEVTDEIWSLWAKEPIHVCYSPMSTMQDQSITSAITNFVDSVNRNKPTTRAEKKSMATAMLRNFRHGYATADPYTDYVPLDAKPRINIPGSLVGDRILDSVPDIYTLADAITGFGLESMERDVACLDIGYDGLMLVGNTIDISKDDPNSPTRDAATIIAQCALDVWYAACIRDIRTKILTQWPGWHSIFAAQDLVMLPPTDDMENTVKTKSKYPM